MKTFRDAWLNLFEKAVLLMQKSYFGGKLTILPSWETANTIRFLRLEVLSADAETLLRSYIVFPWADYMPALETAEADGQAPNTVFLTVADFGIVYALYPGTALSGESEYLLERFDAHLKSIIDFSYTQQLQEEVPVLPDSVQVMSLEVFPYYIDAEAALPGSRMPPADEWRETVNGRMLRLHLVPDMGRVKLSWISPRIGEMQNAAGDALSDSGTIGTFGEALDTANRSPGSREKIFERYKSLLPLAMEKRLFRWLLVEEPPVPVYPNEENIFGGYQPKMSPDTIADYMPALINELDALPEADTANLPALVEIFLRYKNLAEAEPGMWEEGNMILGARPQEYRPSKYELLLSETGERIRKIAEAESGKTASLLKKKYGGNPPDLHYKRFTVIHLDVMGSGRFFYIDTIEDVNVLGNP